MTDVYVLVHVIPYEGQDVIGVFSTLGKAREGLWKDNAINDRDASEIDEKEKVSDTGVTYFLATTNSGYYNAYKQMVDPHD